MTATLRDIDTLLGVWAHPDDEAYLSSALMARVRGIGGRVVVATATRGEHGTEDPTTWPPERLARVRESELLASLAVLDVHEHEWLGHTDGTLADVSLEAGAAQVAAIMERVHPDVVVTFGPDGMTGHADHRTISAWTTRAWQDGGCRGELWYATLTPELLATWHDLNSRLGIWYDGSQPPSTPSSELAAQIHCDADLRDLKHRVLRAHASQTAALEELVGTETYREWWSTESFVAAARSAPPSD